MDALNAVNNKIKSLEDLFDQKFELHPRPGTGQCARQAVDVRRPRPGYARRLGDDAGPGKGNQHILS